MVPSPYRIKFTKTGALQFISHLDLNRTMTRVLVRAGLPVHYSEGFNPHPKIAFGPPLSVGSESVCEFMDFRLDTDENGFPEKEITERLNRALPPEMRVLETYVPQTHLSQIAFAEYRISCVRPFDVSPLFSEKIVVSKRTKKGYADTDIKPMIAGFAADETGTSLRCVLSARPDSYLNPEYVASALSLNDFSILRTEMYISYAGGTGMVFR